MPGEKGNRSLYRFLLEVKAELLIRKRKESKRMFEEDVALGNIVFAVDEALKKIKEGEN